MNYHILFLVAMGLLGVVLHNLVKLDSINRESQGSVNLAKYFAMERFSILISLIVVIVASLASQEIKELKLAGNYLALGFVAIGYLAQSILIKFMGKAQKVVNKSIKDDKDN